MLPDMAVGWDRWAEVIALGLGGAGGGGGGGGTGAAGAGFIWVAL